jgi:hypothetical protein
MIVDEPVQRTVDRTGRRHDQDARASVAYDDGTGQKDPLATHAASAARSNAAGQRLSVTDLTF